MQTLSAYQLHLLPAGHNEILVKPEGIEELKFIKASMHVIQKVTQTHAMFASMLEVPLRQHLEDITCYRSEGW